VLTATATKSQFTKIPSGTYEVKYDTVLVHGNLVRRLYRSDYNGGSRVYLSNLSGLVIDTTDASLLLSMS
jgi:hypothetical protein